MESPAFRRAEDVKKDLAAKLRPGGAALFLLIVNSTPDKVLPEVAPFGGEIIQTSLSQDAEDHLREAAKAAQAAATEAK